jgi:hypothetical protein
MMSKNNELFRPMNSAIRGGYRDKKYINMLILIYLKNVCFDFQFQNDIA